MCVVTVLRLMRYDDIWRGSMVCLVYRLLSPLESVSTSVILSKIQNGLARKKYGRTANIRNDYAALNTATVAYNFKGLDSSEALIWL